MAKYTKGKSRSIKELIFGRGFYMALIICLVAAGIAVLAAVRQNTKTEQIDVPITAQRTTAESSSGTTKQHVTTKNQITTTEKSSEQNTEREAQTEPVVDTQIPYHSFYSNPVAGNITKFFSENLVYSETMNDYRTHNGIDYLANSGDSVYAINKGTVIAVYEDEMLGNVIEIDHAHNVVARYCSVKTELSVGSKVNLGDKIGTVDMIPFEAVEDTHVHLEIFLNGNYVDPLDLMSKTNED